LIPYFIEQNLRYRLNGRVAANYLNGYDRSRKNWGLLMRHSEQARQTKRSLAYPDVGDTALIAGATGNRAAL
jgi:hypothetical protein